MKGVVKHVHSKHSVVVDDNVLKKALGLKPHDRIEFCRLYDGHRTVYTKKYKNKTDYISTHEFTYSSIPKEDR